MTVLVSANAKRVGNGGFGTLGSLIPPESFFFDDVDSPTAEFRGEITTFPLNGTLFAFNDGRFIYSGDGSSDSFTYSLYKDGVFIGSYIVTLNGSGTHFNQNITKSSLQVQSKQLTITTGNSLALIKSQLGVTSKLLTISASLQMDLIKSQVVIVGKTLNSVFGSVLDIQKSTLASQSKNITVETAASFNSNLIKSQLSVNSKTLTFETISGIELQKSQLNIVSKQFEIEYGSNLELIKSTLTVNPKFLSIGTVEIKLPSDRIFAIPENIRYFTVPVSTNIIKM